MRTSNRTPVRVIKLRLGRVDALEDLDLRIKLREYAAAGIPNYWVVALDGPVSLVAYSLAGGRYELAVGGAQAIDVVSPSPMSLDLDALLRRR
jgi:hypothetical protein